jgi:arylsulfatase A-like enzyme
MKRRIIAVAFAMVVAGLAPQARSAPNVVFILIDDLGWTDLGCYGSRVYETPAIDKLAAQGMRFTQAYSAFPLCNPSRYAILTGRHPSRPVGPKDQCGYLRPEEVTIAETLKTHGYATFFAGKWHLTDDGKYPTPDGQGFDKAVGVGLTAAGATASHFYPYGKDGHPRSLPDLKAGGRSGEYLTDRLTTETIQFIRDHRTRPFFVYLSHYAVHTPLEGKKQLVAQYERKIGAMKFTGAPFAPVRQDWYKRHQDNPVNAAMIASVDTSVQRVMRTLKELNLDKNTLVIFTSDNGGDSCGPKESRVGKGTANVPLKAGKRWIYEGGTRVPLIVRWPGAVKTGATDALVAGMDHYATILEMLGLPAAAQQALDSVSFAPVLRGKPRPLRKPSICNYPGGLSLHKTNKAWSPVDGGASVRDGDYKLLEFADGSRELYHVATDIGEQRDLSQSEPEVLNKLRAELAAWREEMRTWRDRRPSLE